MLKDKNDKSFLHVKFWSISEGLCRNNVDFTYDSITNSIPTVYNKPILAAFNKSKEEFEEHNDLGIKIDTETGESFVDYDSGFFDKLAEKSIGVIPADSSVAVEDYDGKKWLTFTGLIWTKYNHKAVKALKKLETEKVSVEITVIDYEEVDNIIIVKSFILDGITIIGVPEGIEGANIKVGKFMHDFSKSSAFNKFEKSLAFAYKEQSGEPPEEEKESNGKDVVNVEFGLKNMGIMDFNKKVRKILNEYKYDYVFENGDKSKFLKYYLYDAFVDENFLILEDCEFEKLIKVPFSINEEREVIIDFEKQEEVEISYVETTYQTKVNFAEHKIKVDDDGNEIIDFQNVNLDEFVSKKEYSDLIVFKESLESQLKEKENLLLEKENFLLEKDNLLKEKEEKILTQEQFLLEKDNKYTTLEKELEIFKDKCYEFEKEKFLSEATLYVDKIKSKFDNEECQFVDTVNENLNNKTITNMSQLKQFVADKLLEKVEKETNFKNNIVNSNLNTDIENVAKKRKGNSIFDRM